VEELKEKAFLISLVIILALSAIIAPSSADHSITDGNVECTSGDTIWTYTVHNDGSPAISNWVVFWCNPDAILDVQVGTSSIPKCADYVSGDWCYEYTHGSSGNPQQGIKIEYNGSGDSPSPPGGIGVTIKLNDCGYDESDSVDYKIKAGQDLFPGTLTGPVCTPGIPEFSTIALPVASILGLLFLFNNRKRRKED
jgi:hypothetical protein